MKRRKNRGFFIVDAVVALGLLTAAALILVAGRSALTRSTHAGNDRREAVRIVEQYFADAANQPGVAPTTVPATTQSAGEPTFVVTPLPTPAPAGWRWVSARATVNGRAGELVGLVRGEQ